MKLEDLVPPIEMCKQIPAGKFANTVFVWLDCQCGAIVREYENHEGAHYYKENGLPWYPAPTLQEILAELPERVFDMGGEVFRHDGKSFYSTGIADATSALRLWFKVNGIEVKG